ncbi:MAG: hypothetical protein ABJI96_04920 [Paracoccaceae bacterium]
MSNPVSNAEVEDVLSSVRRLVSSDPRPMSRVSNEMRSRDESIQSGVDRLVLTPALRVADVPNGLGTDKDEVEDLMEADNSTEEELNNTEGAPSAGSDLDSHESVIKDGQELAVHLDEATDMEASRFFARGESEPSWKGPITEIDPEELRFLFRARKRSVPVIDAIEDEVLVTETQENLEIDSVDGDAGEDKKQAPLLLIDPAPNAAMRDEQVEFDAIAEPENVQSSVNPDNTVPLHELTAKIAAVEAVIAETHDKWDPDDDGVDEYAGTPTSGLDWEGHVELDASGEALDDDGTDSASEVSVTANETETRPLRPETWVIPPDAQVDQSEERTSKDQTESYSEDNPNLADVEPAIAVQQDEEPGNVQALDHDEILEKEAPNILDEMVLDEEALREMIADIVRQELSGSMGERITHNVRKLVRRELQRALVAEELQ